MTSNRSTLLAAALTATAISALAAPVHAGSLDVGSDTCNAPVNTAGSGFINIVNHVFMYASDGVTSDQVWIAYGRGTSWGWYQLTTYTAGTQQLACAAAGGQGLVVYRDRNGGLHSRDRFSTWTEFTVPGTSGTIGRARWATTVNDQGRQKIVLFSLHDDATMTMSIWDDGAGGGANKWGNAVNITVPPGLTSADHADQRMTGYAYDLGGVGAPTTPSISVFIVGLDGHLWENKGGLASNTRSWVDRAVPSGKTLSTELGFRPTATLYRATVGHPPPLTENDYNRRVMVPTSDRLAVYASSQTGSASPSWQQIGGSTTTPPNALSLTSGLVRAPGCAPGAPCPLAVRTVGHFPVPMQLQQFAEHLSVSQSSGTWATLPSTSDVLFPQAVLVRPDSAVGNDQLFDAALVYIKNGSSAHHYDTKTNVDIDIGHP